MCWTIRYMALAAPMIIDRATLACAPATPLIQGCDDAENGRLGSPAPPAQRGRHSGVLLTARDDIADRINGLGLSIVATIMQLHNGRYSVSSEDGVTCFELFFPGRQA